MAAPTTVTTKNLTGKWSLNRTLSDSVEPGLSLQGINFVLRKSIGLATINIDLKQSESGGVTRIDLDQSAAGMKPTHEERILDDQWRDHSDWIFGTVRTRTKWASAADLDDDFLRKGWISEGDFIWNLAENVKGGWTAIQVWGFMTVNGERRHVRKLLVQKGNKRAEVRLVYDYQS
ncbi:hypothetical protein S7711_08282 [Stachybotrys chartarum IBT 7711]|uniref:Lipocalin-like domain-containing protein n=1 Tax=Stachybotrys chartarum (strain CBS 109288 / IBT 7711) TaxID=1280523 RepID=A0A084AIP5_STACB|nr:hypothetical protein S7711_08282 [Stachybotrys chartarum IBT 7711]KFA48498.1 hypothetical protein S40293_00291 [Stachybotrys chartarum IBT 40293]KFA74798.1 hypothetical protein S40288_03526 [Stachybotrys chartarum IBT 40288]